MYIITDAICLTDTNREFNLLEPTNMVLLKKYNDELKGTSVISTTIRDDVIYIVRHENNLERYEARSFKWVFENRDSILNIRYRKSECSEVHLISRKTYFMYKALKPAGIRGLPLDRVADASNEESLKYANMFSHIWGYIRLKEVDRYKIKGNFVEPGGYYFGSNRLLANYIREVCESCGYSNIIDGKELLVPMSKTSGHSYYISNKAMFSKAVMMSEDISNSWFL